MNLLSVLLLLLVLLLAITVVHYLYRSRHHSACQGCKLRGACKAR